VWVYDLSVGQGQVSFDLSLSQWHRFGTGRTPLIRNDPKLGQVPTFEAWYLYQTCPTGTSTTCPSGTGRVPVPVGQVVLVPVGQTRYQISQIPHQKSGSNQSKIETKNRIFFH